MKTNKKIIAVALFTVLAGLQQTAHAWMATLKVMQHPDSGHVVRLAGDIHAAYVGSLVGENVADSLEKEFLLDIEGSLSKFLGMDPKEYECFVVEKTALDLVPNYRSYQNALFRGEIGAVPLVRRINIMVHPVMSLLSVKSTVAHIGECELKPNIEVMAYDPRSKYLQRIDQGSFENSYKFFLKNLMVHHEELASDIKKFMNYGYHPRFHDVVKNKGLALLKDLYMNTYKPGTLDLKKFFTFLFADFGYLTYIAQNAYKNMTLYLGATHCDNLSQDLEKMGYKTIFEKGMYDEVGISQGRIPGPLSKKEYQEFFAAGRMDFKK